MSDDVQPVEVTPSDLEWEHRAQRLEFDALDGARSAARLWGGSVGALLGVFGLVTAVKGPTDVTGLQHGYAIVVGCLVAVALILGVLAVFLAGLAGQGTPRTLDRPTGENLRQYEWRQFDVARRQLFFSRACALAAAAAVAASVAFTWYAPRHDTRQAAILSVRLCRPARLTVVIYDPNTTSPRSAPQSKTRVSALAHHAARKVC